MPMTREKQLQYQRRRRLKGRICEVCGNEPAVRHHKPARQTRTIVIGSGCASLLGLITDHLEDTMTGEEEAVLKEYLLHHGEIEDDEGFEHWYRQRFEDFESEAYYKHTLNLAQVWKGRFEEGFKAGANAIR